MGRIELQVRDADPILLTDEPQVVDATNVVLIFHDAPTRDAYIDGVLTRLPAGNPSVFAMNLTRSVGFHRVEVGGHVVWFGTTDGKLRLDGLTEMLAELSADGTGWSGQIAFSDGSLLRDPHVVYGWLDSNADRLLEAMDKINRQPLRGSRLTTSVTTPNRGRVDVSRTLSLLRTRPRDYLEQSESGALIIDDVAYDPRRVVVRVRERALATVWNQRYVHLAEVLARLVQEVMSAATEPTRLRCDEWLQRCAGVVRHPTALEVKRKAIPLDIAYRSATAVELTDSRYGIVFNANRMVFEAFGWSASTVPVPTYAYVSYADQIFQAYAATRIARCLGLTRRGATLGALQPAFVGDQADLYYDSVPPDDVLASWRLGSSTPDSLRPDVLVVEKSSGAVALVDAKYRQHAGRATEDSRKDVISYMGSYGLTRAGIAYPNKTRSVPDVVEASGQRLVEIPIAPDGRLDDATLAGSLGSLFCHGAFPA